MDNPGTAPSNDLPADDAQPARPAVCPHFRASGTATGLTRCALKGANRHGQSHALPPGNATEAKRSPAPVRYSASVQREDVRRGRGKMPGGRAAVFGVWLFRAILAA